ncbi:MAG: FAD-dependent oxidoreductase [Planctomycetes bacterium]|nr:FAD-dependent oxidoreductase [Planctomycetota bacterium]
MSLKDLPISAHSMRSMAEHHTGSWRSVEPFYQDRTALCAHACPAGEDLPLQVELLHERRLAEAIDVLRLANPFPAVVGRVCPAPCETSCLRATIGGSVSLRAIERFLGDAAIARALAPAPRAARDGRVAVVGAGPAGLSAAYFLGMEGWSVTVFEEKEKAGGLLRYGIPPFRLPRDVLDAELALVFRLLPVEFRFGARVTDLERERIDAYDAVVLAAGKNAAADPRVPGAAPGMSGLGLLEAIGRGERPALSGRIAVIGGGSTAFDGARVARRLGAEPTIYYRRPRAQMPAFAHDLLEAEEEGVPIVDNVTPLRVRPGAVTFARTRSADRRSPVEIVPDSEHVEEADRVLFATGEIQETLFPDLQPGGAMPVDASFATSAPRYFAAGDFTSAAPGTVSGAIRQGRLAAASVHAILTGAPPLASRLLSHERGASEEVVRLEDLNLHYFEERPRAASRRRPARLRIADFAEADTGLAERAVAREAERCMSCGTCVFCFNCRTYCADGAVRFDESEQRFSIDLDYCKGCLVCVSECPRHCMGSRYAEAGTADGK